MMDSIEYRELELLWMHYDLEDRGDLENYSEGRNFEEEKKEAQLLDSY